MDLRIISLLQKSEIYAILIIVSGLLISLFNDFYHGEIITQKVRTEIVQASDSLALIEKKIKGEILININTASIEDLKLLKGIGEKTANKILVYRNEHKFNKKRRFIRNKRNRTKKIKTDY